MINENFKQIFLREGDHYSINKLYEVLEISSCSNKHEYITELRAMNIISRVINKEVHNLNLTRENFVVTYVGVSVVKNRIIFCCPKYFGDSVLLDNKRFNDDLKNIFAVLRKFSKSYLDITEGTGEDLSDNRIALMLKILELFYDYGLYQKTIVVDELNGNGIVNWNKTIDTLQPIIKRNSPIYIDYYSKKRVSNDEDFIKKIHKSIISESFWFLKKLGLSELLMLDDMDLELLPLNQLGERDYLLYVIDKELSAQFVSWKIEILHALKLYISEDSNYDTTQLKSVCIGTDRFEYVWEAVCKKVFNDLLAVKIYDINNIKYLKKYKTQKKFTLKDIIPSPIWFNENKTDILKSNKKTLEPDIVTFFDVESKNFAILDAKYYVPNIRDGKITGEPRLDSIDKQLLYQYAFKSFIQEQAFKNVFNIFLVPSSYKSTKLLAHVDFADVISPLKSKTINFAKGIDMWAIPARLIFEKYLNNTKSTNILKEINSYYNN